MKCEGIRSPSFVARWVTSRGVVDGRAQVKSMEATVEWRKAKAKTRQARTAAGKAQTRQAIRKEIWEIPKTQVNGFTGVGVGDAGVSGTRENAVGVGVVDEEG